MEPVRLTESPGHRNGESGCDVLGDGTHHHYPVPLISQMDIISLMAATRDCPTRIILKS